MHFSFLCSIDLQKKTSFLQNCRRRYPDTPKRGNVTILAGARPLRVFHRETRLIKLNNIHVVIIIFSLFENFEFLNYFGSVCEKLNGKKNALRLSILIMNIYYVYVLQSKTQNFYFKQLHFNLLFLLLNCRQYSNLNGNTN